MGGNNGFPSGSLPVWHDFEDIPVTIPPSAILRALQPMPVSPFDIEPGPQNLLYNPLQPPRIEKQSPDEPKGPKFREKLFVSAPTTPYTLGPYTPSIVKVLSSGVPMSLAEILGGAV